MRRWCLILLIAFTWSSRTQAQSYTVETVPNQKLVDGSFVSNPDNIINETTVAVITEKLSALEKQTTVQVAVVLINSIGDQDIFDFAQRLFNTWGVGHSQNNNGLLVLMVNDQRTIRFHTGYGLESALPDAICKHIQMESIIPAFKEGDYDKGMIAGIESTIAYLTDPKYADELKANLRETESGWKVFFWLILGLGCITALVFFLVLRYSDRFSDFPIKDKSARKNQPYPELKVKSSEWILIYFLIPLAGLITFDVLVLDFEYPVPTFLLMLYIYFGLALILKRSRMAKVTGRLVEEKKYYEGVEFYQDRQIFWLVMGILIPLPILFIFFYNLLQKKRFRNHPRNCKSCNNSLTKLSETNDDQYLSKSQIFEEGLKSIDYDVWLCSNCKSTETLRYVNRFSKYKACPACKAQTYYTSSRRTITDSTYDATGKGEQIDKCKFCNHVNTSYYTIPVKTRSDSSSGGSGGGSWGGGSSGGGGASSSW